MLDNKQNIVTIYQGDEMVSVLSIFLINFSKL